MTLLCVAFCVFSRSLCASRPAARTRRDSVLRGDDHRRGRRIAAASLSVCARVRSRRCVFRIGECARAQLCDSGPTRVHPWSPMVTHLHQHVQYVRPAFHPCTIQKNYVTSKYMHCITTRSVLLSLPIHRFNFAFRDFSFRAPPSRFCATR